MELLLMILQRYTFGSKSQQVRKLQDMTISCLWYCKDIHLEANHNAYKVSNCNERVAYDIAKIYIWKQITTLCVMRTNITQLLMILQRYTFGSKSQHTFEPSLLETSCLWYCKDIHLEANHNATPQRANLKQVAYDIAKIYIWKQITTYFAVTEMKSELLMILQRYTFGSKSQQRGIFAQAIKGCLWYCKDIHLEANHNYS